MFYYIDILNKLFKTNFNYMHLIFIINIINVCINFVTLNDIIDNNYDNKLNQNCVCVPYWQCKDDFSGLIDDGVDLMDIR